MPLTRRQGRTSQNPPWVSHSRTIVDVDEIDEQSIAEAKSVRSRVRPSSVQHPCNNVQSVVTQSRSNAKPPSSITGRSEIVPSAKSPPRKEIRATAAREFFLGIRDRSIQKMSIEGSAEAKADSLIPSRTTAVVDTSTSSEKQALSPQDRQLTGGYSILESPKSGSQKEKSVEDVWVYSDPASEGRIAGRLTEHEGQQGRWLLFSDPGYPSQRNWTFAPEKNSKPKRFKRKQGKRSSEKAISFLSLPGELRNKIYAEAIPECRILVAATKPNKDHAKLKGMWSEEDVKHKRERMKLFHVLDNSNIDEGFELTIALLSTCREVRDDVEQYLYSRTMFCFDSMNVLDRFLRTASKPGLRAIRKVELVHQGYSNPENTRDRVFRDKYYAKWLRTCTLFGNELIGLEELKLEAVLTKWPCEFAALNDSKDIWRKGCVQLAPRRLKKVHIRLQHPMIRNNRNVLVDLARTLEDDMMTQEGKEARDKWEYDQVVNAVKAKKRAEREAKAKAKQAELLAAKPWKPLSITKEDIQVQSSIPVKAVNKGLEKYSRIDIGGMCPEELDYFKQKYCSQKHKAQIGC